VRAVVTFTVSLRLHLQLCVCGTSAHAKTSLDDDSGQRQSFHHGLQPYTEGFNHSLCLSWDGFACGIEVLLAHLPIAAPRFWRYPAALGNMKSDPVEPGSLPIVAISREKGAQTSSYNLAMQLER
jgi:hypothetical protein